MKRKIINKIICFSLGSIVLFSVKASATEVMLPSFRNIVTGTNLTQTAVVKGWVQKVNPDNTIGWNYIDDDGTKHVGWLNDNGKYYFFNEYGELVTNFGINQ